MARHPLPLDPPAEVRPVDDLAALAAEINATHTTIDRTIRSTLSHAHRAGQLLLRAKAKCKHGTWLPWLQENISFSQQTVSRYMRVAHLELLNLSNLTQTEALQLLAEEGEPQAEEKMASYITLPAWQELTSHQQYDALHTLGKTTFNAQGDNESIEWALWSWNPVTGCLHNCPYCYARDIADRFYEHKFVPTLHPDRLSAPQNTKFPTEKAKEWMGHRNVFVCSMADLFGRWVPGEWIDAVLDQVRAAPQWTFLFLTKFPIRMAEFDFPDNAWVGTTVDCQARVANAERSFRKVKAGVKWLSLEPLIEPLQFKDLGAFQWIVLGGASRSRQTPEWHPPRPWVTAIEGEALRLGIPYYEKSNLHGERVRSYPGLPQSLDTAPEELRYLAQPEEKASRA